MGIIKRILKKGKNEALLNKLAIADNSKFKPGMPIFLELESESNDGGNPPAFYVNEVFDDGSMLISCSAPGDNRYGMPEDEEFSMYFVNESAKSIFSVCFCEEVVKDNKVYLKVKRRGSVKEINRRDSYRIKLSLPVKIEIIPAEENGEKHPINIDGETIDLSRSGARFVTDWYIGEEQETSMIINLEKDQSEKLKVSFVRMTETENKYDFRVKLEYIDNNQQSRFFGYLAAKEREARRREKYRPDSGKDDK